MIYSIVYERVDVPSLPAGYYYAHIPALDLTAHSLGFATEGLKRMNYCFDGFFGFASE